MVGKNTKHILFGKGEREEYCTFEEVLTKIFLEKNNIMYTLNVLK